MIRIERLVKRFGAATAVDEVSLAVPAGDSLALWGANGAGKTTIIRCVLGLFRFDGIVEVGGYDVMRRGKDARRLIGYVPQELGFYDDLGVAEALRLFARLKSVAAIDVDDVLARVRLEGQDRKRIRELSGGMKQRLALATALLGDPPVLVLDEVTASLDACGREEFVGLIAGLAGGGRTVLFASHRSDEVAMLARRVALLERGRLAGECTSEEFAGRIRGDAMLHIHLPTAVRADAAEALRLG